MIPLRTETRVFRLHELNNPIRINTSIITWIDLFWKCSAQVTYWEAVVILAMYATCFIYNACQLELAGILLLENANKHQHFEACLQFDHQNAC